jgi:hypothetical protein
LGYLALVFLLDRAAEEYDRWSWPFLVYRITLYCIIVGCHLSMSHLSTGLSKLRTLTTYYLSCLSEILCKYEESV